MTAYPTPHDAMISDFYTAALAVTAAIGITFVIVAVGAYGLPHLQMPRLSLAALVPIPQVLADADSQLTGPPLYAGRHRQRWSA